VSVADVGADDAAMDRGCDDGRHRPLVAATTAPAATF